MRHKPLTACARSLLTGTVLLFGALVVPTTATADPGQDTGEGYRYVALGDSYAAASSWNMMDGDPLGCLSATDSYPADVARLLAATDFADVSCSAATVEYTTRPQVPNVYGVPVGGLNAAQFDALTPDTDLVTATFGGDDINFADILQTCAGFAFQDPGGRRCTDFYTAGGFDQLAARIDTVAPSIALMLDSIHARSPHAKVAVVGYLPVMPADGGSCFPRVPIAAGDAVYMRDTQRRLNDRLAVLAAEHDAVYIDADVPGHDACQGPGVNWNNPLIPEPITTWPFHPNAAGHAYLAEQVVQAVRG